MDGRSIPANNNGGKSREFVIDLFFAGALVGIPLFVVIFCLLWAAGIIGDPSLAGRLTSIGGDAFGLGVIVTFRKVALQRLTRRYGGKATIPLEFRRVGSDCPPDGIIVAHTAVELDEDECKYEVRSGARTLDKGNATLVSALDTGAHWSVVTPTPSTQGDTLLLTLKERNSARTWKTRPFHIETPPIIARSAQ